jgi:hypothetical protein
MPNRVEKVASEAMGAVKTIAATIGSFKQLAREHGEVTALLIRIRMTSDPAARRDLLELLLREKGSSRENAQGKAVTGAGLTRQL